MGKKIKARGNSSCTYTGVLSTVHMCPAGVQIRHTETIKINQSINNNNKSLKKKYVLKYQDYTIMLSYFGHYFLYFFGVYESLN